MFAKIGRITPAESGTNPLRADNLGGLVVSGGDYKDMTLSGKHYFAFCQSQNVALYTAVAAIGLQIYNPPASNVNVIPYLWSVTVWATSATMTGMVLAVTTQPLLPPTGTTAATRTGPTLLNSIANATGSSCVASSIATLATAPVIVWPLFHNTAAINTVGAEVISGDLQGAFGFAPGTVLVIGALGAAGVTVNIGLTWEEVPTGL